MALSRCLDATIPWEKEGTTLSGPRKCVMHDIDSATLDCRVSREVLEFNLAAAQFWRMLGRRRITRIKVFHNPFLEERFEQLKQKAHDHAGKEFAREIFVFHGTTPANAAHTPSSTRLHEAADTLEHETKY